MQEKPVICRLTRQTLGVAAVFGLCTLCFVGLLFFVPKNPNIDVLAAAFLLSISGVPTLLLIHAYKRCRIIGEQNGLEICGLFTRKYIEWDKITDFYFELASSGNKSQKPRIFIEYDGRKYMISRNFENLPALLEYIVLKATDTQTEKFEFRETRGLLDTPQIYEYGNPKIWPLILTALSTWILMIGSMVGPVILQKGWSHFYATNFIILSPAMRLGLIALILIFSGVPLLMGLAGIPIVKTTRKFIGQQILASKSGIEWRQGANKINILWEQVRNYHFEKIEGNFQPLLLVVESERDRITFLRSIPQCRVLQLLISQNAINATTDSWQYAAGHDEDVLHRDSTIVIDGKQVFHYRTRMNRAFLGGSIVLSISMALVSYFGLAADSSPFYVAIMVGIPTLLGVLAYCFSRIEIEKDGVRYVSLFKQNYLNWNEVTNLKIGYFYSIIGKGKTVHVVHLVSEPANFKKVVAERSGKTWREPEEKADFLIGH